MPVRLMIVDDHADVRHLLRAIVEDAPVAGEADGARAACALAEAAGIAVCLSKDDLDAVPRVAFELAFV